MSRRTVAVVLVVVGVVSALVISARLNPVYQLRAVVSLGVVASEGPDSPAEQLAVARGRAVRKAARAHLAYDAEARVAAIDDGALEFRARSRDPKGAADVANAYARSYVEERRDRRPDQTRPGPPHAPQPTVVIPARPAGSPLPPWPSQTWTLAGMVLLALAMAVPGPDAPPVGGTGRPAG